MTWPEFCRSNEYKGRWVAIDNCRYDQSTRQPVEGDVVDSDAELSELCARMREAGNSVSAAVSALSSLVKATLNVRFLSDSPIGLSFSHTFGVHPGLRMHLLI